MAKYYGGKEIEKGLEKLGKELGLPKDTVKGKEGITESVNKLLDNVLGTDAKDADTKGKKKKK